MQSICLLCQEALPLEFPQRFNDCQAKPAGQYRISTYTLACNSSSIGIFLSILRCPIHRVGIAPSHLCFVSP